MKRIINQCVNTVNKMIESMFSVRIINYIHACKFIIYIYIYQGQYAGVKKVIVVTIMSFIYSPFPLHIVSSETFG